MQIDDRFELESLPYSVLTLDLDHAHPGRETAAAVAASGCGGAYIILREHGRIVGELILNGCSGAADPAIESLLDQACLHHRSSQAETEPVPCSVAVVICTKDRPDGLERCLRSLERQTDSDFSVVVVDNSATPSESMERVSNQFGPLLGLVCVEERVQGLSRARNAGLTATDADVVAWIDDDEEADPTWIEGIRRTFLQHPDVSVVLGRMLPARIETAADVMFEEFGGHNKGSGDRPQSFTKTTVGWRIFYPLPPFGTGGNMAFRRSIVDRVGRFDELLGAGSVCPAGEDTLFFSEALDAGLVLHYAPWIVTWHHHRGTEEELVHQLFNYGVGLGGFFAAVVCNRPRRVLRLAVMLPRGLLDLFDKQSIRNAGQSGKLLELRGGNRIAILRGAVRYLRARYAESASPIASPIGAGALRVD